MSFTLTGSLLLVPVLAGFPLAPTGETPEQTRDPVQEMVLSSSASSDTLTFVSNLASVPIHILHGERDDTVPVTESGKMAEILRPFHKDFIYHEQPGVGHWWEVSPVPGTDCVGWAPMGTSFPATGAPPTMRFVSSPSKR